MTECVTIIEDGFGFVPHNLGRTARGVTDNIVRRYTMTNNQGGSVQLISFGAGIQSIRMPDGLDVVFGFDDMEGYLKSRFIGRIVNNPGERFCGYGYLPEFEDFDLINWNSCIVDGQVVMSCSRQAENPSHSINVHVIYNWNDENELKVTTRATSTYPTPTNLSLFCPMNLAGHGAGPEELKNHIVTINYLKIADNKSDGKIMNRNVFNFRTPTKLKDRLSIVPGGSYNLNFRINSPSERSFIFCGRIVHPASRRTMEIYSNQSNLKFSTLKYFPDPQADNLNDHDECKTFFDHPHEIDRENYAGRREIRGKSGSLYKRNGGFVFSSENSTSEFSEQGILFPSQVFASELSYRFGKKL